MRIFFALSMLLALAAPVVAQTTEAQNACNLALASSDGTGTSGGYTILIQRRQITQPTAQHYQDCYAAAAAVNRFASSTGAEIDIQRRQNPQTAEPLIQRRQ